MSTDPSPARVRATRAALSGELRTSGSRWLAPWSAFAAALALFASRAAPGVTFEDSGELATATVVWGVPHPPGYPLQMLVGRLWWEGASFFTNDPARALNLFSAVCAAGAVGWLASFTARLGARFGAAFATGALLALSTTFAAQAVVTEVYALTALVLVLLLREATTAQRPLTRSAFLFGLALCAHPVGLFTAPLVAVASARELREGSALAASMGRALAALALGLSPYLYVPLAAARDPLVNWGRIDGVERLADHLLRAQYSTGIERAVSNQLAFLAEQLAGQWPLALGACVLALVCFPRRVPRAAFASTVLTLVVAAAGIFASVNYPLDLDAAKWRLAGSYVPLVVLVAALCGLGLVALEGALARLPRPATALGIPLGVALLALPFPPRTLATSLDQRAATWAEDYARETLAACPPNALLVLSGVGYSDVLHFPLLYLQGCRGMRRDVLLVNRELLQLAWYRDELAARHPELADASARLSQVFASSPLGGPAERRGATASFFPGLFGGPRPLVFVARPNELVTGGHPVVPGPVLWEERARVERVSSAPPAWTWLPADDRDPWIAELRRLARERDRARAALLEAQGELAAARRLRERFE